MSKVPEFVYGLGDTVLVDDCLIWTHAQGVTFHSQILVDWNGYGFHLAVPGWPYRGFVDSSAWISGGLASTWNGPLLPVVAALARELDDGGSKRTWTLEEIQEIANPLGWGILIDNVNPGITIT